MNFYHKIYFYQESFFTLFIFTSYLLLLASFLGWSSSASAYLVTIDYYIKIYICLFLLFRFNPFTKITTFTELDRKIVFSAGLFILTTTTLNRYLLDTTNQIKSILF